MKKNMTDNGEKLTNKFLLAMLGSGIVLVLMAIVFLLLSKMT